MAAVNECYTSCGTGTSGMINITFDNSHPSSIDLSDYISNLEETLDDSKSPDIRNDHQLVHVPIQGGGLVLPASPISEDASSSTISCSSSSKRNKVNTYTAKKVVRRVAFRTKSAVEIMDDGFRWRKYGQKTVKSSPNPRNYYRCSTEGCSVKKRVERDQHEASYVITTYEGVHNHTSPDVVYHATQDALSGRFVVSGASIM